MSTQSLEAITEMQDYLQNMPIEEANRLIGWLMVDLPRDPYFFDQIQEFRAHRAATFPEGIDAPEPQSRCSSLQKQAGKPTLATS